MARTRSSTLTSSDAASKASPRGVSAKPTRTHKAPARCSMPAYLLQTAARPSRPHTTSITAPRLTLAANAQVLPGRAAAAGANAMPNRRQSEDTATELVQVDARPESMQLNGRMALATPVQDFVCVEAGARGSADGRVPCTPNTSNAAVQASLCSHEGDHAPGLVEDLRGDLECPICSRIALPPIMQCRNGHTTCNTCRGRVQACPICREVDIDFRNMFAEKAVTFMTIPCENSTFGCDVEVKYREKNEHEKVCKYRPYTCPYIECEQKLAVEGVVDHVSTIHKEDCRKSEGAEITASMIMIGSYFGGDGAWSPRIITCFNRTFFDVALTRDRCLHHWVWLLGEEDDAARYTYEITAFKGNIKYMYGGDVSSLRTSNDEIVNGGLCLSISDAIGNRLRDGDKLRYKLKLMRK